MVVRGHSYDCCSACSSTITSAYNLEGWQFVKRALNEKGYVEELSGLAEVRHSASISVQRSKVIPMAKFVQVQHSAERALADIELIDEGDAEEGEGEGEGQVI